MAGNILEELVKMIRGNEQNVRGFDTQQSMQGNSQQPIQGNLQQPATAAGAGQIAAQQNSPPPTGPLAAEKISADGTIEKKYHPPEQVNPAETSTQQMSARTLPKGPLGTLYPGSDTEQPGAVYKVLTMLAGGGAYKPSTENANLQMTALSGRYQTAKALQDKESDLQRNLINQGGQILQANPITAWQKGIDLKGMLNNVNSALSASQLRYEEANSELAGVLSSYQERLGKSMKAAQETSTNEGKIYVNPKTGQKGTIKGGKWQLIKK